MTWLVAAGLSFILAFWMARACLQGVMRLLARR